MTRCARHTASRRRVEDYLHAGKHFITEGERRREGFENPLVVATASTKCAIEDVPEKKKHTDLAVLEQKILKIR